MGLNDIERNSNGEWVSNHGYQVHVDPYGQPYTGGFPPARPQPQPFDWGNSGGSNGSRPVVAGPFGGYGQAQGGDHGGTLSMASVPVYMWMLVLAFVAYQLTEQIVFADNHLGELIPLGARPIARSACGIGAGLLAIWLYRIAMTRVIGALFLGIISASVLAIAAEYWYLKLGHSVARSFRIPLTWADWAAVGRSPSVLLQLHWSSFAAFATALLFHGVYWRHRRAVARADRRSWSRRINDGFKNLLAIGVVAVGWGLLVAWIVPH